MLKTIVKLEHTIGDKVFQFTCDPEISISTVKEALVKMLTHVTGLEEQAVAREKAQAEALQEKPADIVKTEEENVNK